MIYGIGIDLVAVDRFTKLIENGGDKFLNRYFTQNEISYCEKKVNKYERYAGKFAAKEAIYKALNLQWAKDFSWKEIEVINRCDGSPEIVLCGEIQKQAELKHIAKICISISHTQDHAIAMAILTGGYFNEPGSNT